MAIVARTPIVQPEAPDPLSLFSIVATLESTSIICMHGKENGKNLF